MVIAKLPAAYVKGRSAIWAFRSCDREWRLGVEHRGSGRESGGLADADHRGRRGGDLLDLALGVGSLGDRGQLGLDDRLGVGCLLLVGGRFGEEPVEAAGEVALEAAQRALLGLALGFFAGEVLLGGGVVVGRG